jgi:HipA-like protein
MKSLEIYNNGIFAGILTEFHRQKYVFRYDDMYYNNSELPPISLRLPKTQQEFISHVLFPFFSNMVAEGSNLKIQCVHLKLDEQDVLGLLEATAQTDNIGSITVKPISTNAVE